MSVKLSVVINVKNNAKELAVCLQSVAFADEIVVVDMESTDDSVKVAKNAGAKLFEHQDVGYADPARNFAISKATNAWILVVDADEVIPAQLAQVITKTISNQSGDVYWLPRTNMIFGIWAEHAGWWPDFQPRLFRKGQVSWEVGVHRLPTITGQQVYFAADPNCAIMHHNYTSVDHYVSKLNRYTSIQATERPQKKTSEFSGADLVNVFRAEFLSRFFKEKGLLGNVQGVGLSFLQSFYEIVITLKMWELRKVVDESAGSAIRRSEPSAAEVTETLGAVSKLSSELRYWIAETEVNRSSGLRKIVWQLRRKFRI